MAKLLDYFFTPKTPSFAAALARFVEGLPIEPLGDAETDLMERGDKGIIIVGTNRQKDLHGMPDFVERAKLGRPFSLER